MATMGRHAKPFEETCCICRRWFLPDPRVGARQRACGNPSCQKARHQQAQARCCTFWFCLSFTFERPFLSSIGARVCLRFVQSRKIDPNPVAVQQKVLVAVAVAVAGSTRFYFFLYSLREKPMRWIHIRRADIDPELRKTFERYGIATMQMILATTNYFQHLDKQLMAQNVRDDLLPWLTEQYDRAERKETWSLTMEAAITAFVLIEVMPLIISFFKWFWFLMCCTLGRYDRG